MNKTMVLQTSGVNFFKVVPNILDSNNDLLIRRAELRTFLLFLEVYLIKQSYNYGERQQESTY
jgi:hypothetical protein